MLKRESGESPKTVQVTDQENLLFGQQRLSETLQYQLTLESQRLEIHVRARRS
jgi:hypothetical protein